MWSEILTLILETSYKLNLAIMKAFMQEVRGKTPSAKDKVIINYSKKVCVADTRKTSLFHYQMTLIQEHPTTF